METPRKVTLRRAHKIISRKKQWVLEEFKSAQEKRKMICHIKRHKHSVLLFGKEKLIELKRHEPRKYILETPTKIILGFDGKRLANGLVDHTMSEWLRQKAKTYLPFRVRKLNRGRFKINKILIKDQRTLWGSCSSENNLNLNWRLIMAPQFASDYIIQHELCHTRYLDHSKKFWRLVSRTHPPYTRAEKWFDDYGFVLHIGLFEL